MMSEVNSGKKILIAMSGGIDSTVSAILLKEAGYDVLGVHFVFFEDNKTLKKVKRVASLIGVDLLIKNAQQDFQKRVIDYFLSEYKKGRTPNPCVICNPKIKFQKLIECADKRNISRVATGHYCCIQETKEQSFILKRAKDKYKDQSYFLYRLSQEQLSRIKFPLCELTKKEARQVLIDNGIEIKQKESQDACFFYSQETLRDFLSRYIKKKKGKFIDEEGTVVGMHFGVHLFTIGQRRGLNLNGGPYYITGKDLKKNILFVSKKKDHSNLLTKSILFDDICWISKEPKLKRKYQIMTRYLSKEILGYCSKSGNKWHVRLENSQWGVASGQSLVVYDDDVVVGGGIISGVNVS